MEARASGNDDLCILRGERSEEPIRHFIRGIIPIRIQDVDDTWAIGAWVEVSKQHFQRYRELYDADASEEPRFVGRVANAIKGFDGVLGAEVAVQLGDETQRPTLWFPEDSTQELACVQVSGVTMEQIHAIFGDFV